MKLSKLIKALERCSLQVNEDPEVSIHLHCEDKIYIGEPRLVTFALTDKIVPVIIEGVEI